MQASEPLAPPTRLAGAVRTFSERHWRLVLVAMLLLLHVATVRGVADFWARPLLLAHLGLLLLWQPFVRSHRPISATQATLIGVLAIVIMLKLDWWILAFWTVILAGLVGGKVYQQHARWQRRTYLVVLVYLLAMLAVVVLPEIAPKREISPEVRGYAEHGLPVLLGLILLFPGEPNVDESPELVDFLYSLLLMLLFGVTVLGSFTLMTIGQKPYLNALTETVFIIGVALLIVGLVWSPRTGLGGLDVFVSRYLFSIGLPLERWLFYLAELSQSAVRPERFLAEGGEALKRLPWIAGVAWRAADGDGSTGETSPHGIEYRNPELALTIYSRHRMSPMLQWHLKLLGELLGEFYVAKLREEKLRETAYLQAVHETGARVTHEVKNLLQSLNVLNAVAASSGSEDSARVQGFLRRELPAITARLAETLDRLRRPTAEAEQRRSLAEWWSAAQLRHQGANVEFDAPVPPGDDEVPGGLFDNALDNLLQNAREKRAADPGVRVRVTLAVDGGPALSVEDSGRAVPPETAEHLLRGPVRSRTGMGIGLFQAARQAESLGYRLALESNRDGAVRFALRAA